MTPSDFVRKWKKVALSERSACQQHFLDLCEVFGHPKPAEADPTGQDFCFERGAEKLDGGDGWADVWKKGFFAIEYKGRHKDLAKAYSQLAQYRESLENPPLLAVCDMDRIEVHTNFTGTAKRIYTITLDTFTSEAALDILRNMFNHPERLRPGTTSEAITMEAASKMAQIALRLRERLAAQDKSAKDTKLSTEEAVERIAEIGQQLSHSFNTHAVARFLDRIVFCMFAEDIELLPDHLFTKVVKNARGQPDRFVAMAQQLFETMAKGGTFGFDVVPYFNGNLFDDSPVLPLNEDEIELIYQAAILDWSTIDPSIFGTLFERGLDPDKRAQLGAHYTSRTDIETLVNPVVMEPLLREWEDIKVKIAPLIAKGGKGPRAKADAMAHGFLERLGKLRFLDPACGSGNFLYVTLQKVKDLEKAVNVHLNSVGLPGYLPVVGPWQFFGIEMNPYAAELASMTLWIGYLQWTRANGYGIPDSPVLRKLDNIDCNDAILRVNPKTALEPDWPEADFIFGNPPFLGDKLMRGQLGDSYVESLRNLFGDRIPGQSDLCCYWFEKARAQIEKGKCRRAGLLATQGIRGGANREVLKRIKDTGDIFFAVSDRVWTLDGATVHVSMVGFDNGTETSRVLNGAPVDHINANLTTAADTVGAVPLKANEAMAFLGSCKGGPFDITEEQALAMLKQEGNPNGRPNSDMVRPVCNSEDIIKSPSRRWIIDTADMALETAGQYEAPFAHVVSEVKEKRDGNRDKWLRENWWRPQRMRPEMRNSVKGLPRFLITTTTSKHRIFYWLTHPTLPDHQLIVFASADDYFFGLLHSRVHQVWSLAQGTQLREAESGFRYTPTTCFANFPFPVLDKAGKAAIAAAAKELNDLRERWLNPPEWTQEVTIEFPGSTNGPWAQHIDKSTVSAKTGVGIVRYTRLDPKDAAAAASLKSRTLTKLYNERPTWLDTAHRKLDAAVLAAYGWPADITDAAMLAKLVALNAERAAEEAKVSA